MPTVNVTFDDRDVRRGLTLLQQRGGDMTPAMMEIAGHLVDSVAEAFASEATPGGKTWTPLAEATLRDRQRRRYGAGPILERSGDLASRILADWTDTSAVAGTNVVYAATHHFGDQERGIPARPFLGVSVDARDAILQALIDHLGGK